eukprot:scaffold855_cov364-Pavlova_lutheri.AAC.2
MALAIRRGAPCPFSVCFHGLPQGLLRILVQSRQLRVPLLLRNRPLLLQTVAQVQQALDSLFEVGVHCTPPSTGRNLGLCISLVLLLHQSSQLALDSPLTQVEVVEQAVWMPSQAI